MDNLIKNRKWMLSLLVIFLICYIPRMLFGYILIPYSVYDEGPVMAPAAYFAGKDWTSVAAESAYYGFGYYVLFTPLLIMTDNPHIIYFFIVEVNAFIQAFYGIIAFGIIRKFLKIDNIFAVIVFSCICSYLTTVRPIIYNEIPLVLLNWIIAFVLCSLIKNSSNNKKKIAYTIILFAILAYALTIHTRSVILLLVFSIVALLYRLIYKEWIISLKAIPIGIIFIAIAKCCVKLVQNIVWRADESASIANTKIDLGVDKLNIFDLTTWKGFFLVLIGQVSAINLFCGGLFITALYIFIKYSVVNIIRIKNEENNRYYMVLSLVFLLCCVGMVVGQAMSWMYSIYPSLAKGEVGDVLGYKAFSYVRYMGAFIGPFILCTLVIAEKDKSFLKGIDIVRIVFCNLLILLLWKSYVMPWLEDNPYALEVYAAFCFRKAHDAIGIEQYRAAIPWYLIICYFIVSGCFIKNFKIYYSFVLGLLIFQLSYMAVYNDSYYGEERSQVAAMCDDFLDDLSENCEVPRVLYAYNTDMQRLQFYLNDYQIKPFIPEEITEDTILIYQGKINESSEINFEKWSYVLLGKNVFFLFQQEEYKAVISLLGYEIL